MTDVGMVRELNEDTYLVKEYGDATLFAVFDGMGGAAAGETASALAREEVEKYFDGFFRDFGRTEPAAIQAALASAADRANFRIFSLATADKQYEGMGTTMVAALCIADKVYIANIGDSRAYLIDKDGAYQITRDHSFVQYLVDIGKITPEEARNNPKKNIITRAMGSRDEAMPDFFQISLSEGDKILLCSDGLSNMVEDDEIKDIIMENADADETVDSLIERANYYGGNDNISVIVISI